MESSCIQSKIGEGGVRSGEIGNTLTGEIGDAYGSDAAAAGESRLHQVMKRKNYVIAVLWLALGFVAASCAKTTPYSFYDDYQKTNAEYFSADAATVRASLVGFLGRVENNAATVQGETRLNGELIVGEAWLRLAAICNAQGDAGDANDAMTRAIAHFDKIANFASDPGYKADKAAMLTAFLQKAEQANPPKWRQR